MPKKHKQRLWVLLGVCATLLVAAELVLRFVFGFCDAVLYQPSQAYEYIAQPNQHRHRFFAHIDYNSYSQRSAEPDSTQPIVLGLGDSVIFGGTMLDQDSIATTLFSKETGMQMLNISSGSWGPDNCAAYLREKGTFGAKAMVLVCSSHDAFDVMSHVPVVGIYPNYPDRQYKLALWELVDRYLLPRLKSMFCQPQPADPDAQVLMQSVARGNSTGEKPQGVAQKSLMFNPGFDQLKRIADTHGIPLIIYLHAETGELTASKYKKGGLLIKEWTKKNNVRLIEGLHEGETKDMYRDIIHFNEKGQRLLANRLEQIFKTQWKQ